MITGLPQKRVIVTGGSGFVGTNMVSFLVNQGWQVLNIDILPPRDKSQMPFWRKVDLLDRSSLTSEMGAFGPSVVLHFGARTDLGEKTSLAGYAANIKGVCNVIAAVRSTPSVERVVYTSSQLVCKLGYSPVDENDYQPNTLYGTSKALGERIVRASGDSGAAWTIVRPTSLWGPWFDMPYRDLFLAIAHGRYVHPGHTRTLKQWGFIGNTVHQIWRLIHSPVGTVHRKTLYLADYEPVELRDFVNKIQVSMKARPIRTVPFAVLKAAARLGDAAQAIGWHSPPLTTFRLDNIVTAELRDLCPLRSVAGPLPFNVDQGIELTVKWLEEMNWQEPAHRKRLPSRGAIGRAFGRRGASVTL